MRDLVPLAGELVGGMFSFSLLGVVRPFFKGDSGTCEGLLEGCERADCKGWSLNTSSCRFEDADLVDDFFVVDIGFLIGSDVTSGLER